MGGERRREAAALFTGVLAILPCFLIYDVSSNESLIEAKRWAGQSWERVDCTVVESGFLYEGRCSRPGHSHGHACPVAPGCIGANPHWWAEVISTPEGEDVARSRRLYSKYYHCSNRWLPWLSVTIPGSESPQCAYGYGIRGQEDIVSHDYEGAAFRENFPLGSTWPCWRATGNHCVVAVYDPEDLVQSRRGRIIDAPRWLWFLLPATLSCWVLCAALLTKACIWPAETKERRVAVIFPTVAARERQAAARERKAPELTLPRGHWSQWGLDEIDDAARALLEYFDKDRAGCVKASKMVKIMKRVGINDEDLVMRCMTEMDVDTGGVIDQHEFPEVFHVIIGSSRVMHDYHKQLDVIGAPAASIKVLSADVVLFAIVCVVTIASVIAILCTYFSYGGGNCSTSFHQWLLGALVMTLMELGFLGLAYFCKHVRTVSFVHLQTAFIMLHVVAFSYATVGFFMSDVFHRCDPRQQYGLLRVVVIIMATSLYVIIPATVSALFVCIAHRGHTTPLLNGESDSGTE